MKITVNGIDYDDEVSASKAIRKIRAAEKRQAETAAIAIKQAELIAHANLGRLICVVDALKNGHKRYWQIADYNSCKPVQEDSRSVIFSETINRLFGCGESIEYKLTGYTVTKVIYASTGCIAAICLSEMDDPLTCEWYAIGEFKTYVRLVEIPESVTLFFTHLDN